MSHLVDSTRRHSVALSCLVMAAYLLTFVVFMYLAKRQYRDDFTIGISVYFLVTTITTVGYGDYHFEGRTEKIFAIFFVFLGVGFIGVALGHVLAYFADGLSHIGKKAISELDGSCHRGRSADGAAAAPRRRLRRDGTMKYLRSKYEARIHHLWVHLVKQWVVLLLTVIVGAVGIKFMEDPEDWDWVDAFYFCVVTATTVGYGDETPSTAPARVWTCGLMFCSIVAVANALSSCAAFPLEWRQQREEFAIVTQFGVNLVQDELDVMLESEELHLIRNGGPRQGADNVTRAEFMLWLFLKQERIDRAHIEDAAWAFDELDADGSGDLSEVDIRGALEQKGLSFRTAPPAVSSFRTPARR